MLIATNLLHAQDYKWWTWSDYKVKFKTLDNFKVTANNSNEFKAENPCISFLIYPRKGERLSYVGMKNALLRWANQCELTYDLEEEPVYLKGINGYWGVGFDASYSGVPVAIFLLVDPDFPDISFYIWVDYDHKEDLDICLAILNSFTPI